MTSYYRLFNKKRTGSSYLIRRELVRFVFYGFSLLFKTRDKHRDFLVYRLW